MSLPIIGKDYAKEAISLLNSAKKNVDILMYDWRFYENQIGDPVQQFNLALVRAHQRGVLVRALVWNTSAVPFLQKCGIAVKVLPDRRVLHSKLVLIDRSAAIVGSHNLTRNAFERNLETSVVVYDSHTIERFALFFERLYGV